MKRHSIMAWICIFIFLLGCSSLTWAGAKNLLIKDKEVEGWSTMNMNKFNKKRDLKELLGETYKEYMGYGLKEVWQQEIATPDYRIVLLEIYIARDKPGARGLFRRYRSPLFFAVGDEGSESPGYVCFYRDKYFVKLIAKRKSMEGNPFLKKFSKIVDEKIH